MPFNKETGLFERTDWSQVLPPQTRRDIKWKLNHPKLGMTHAEKVEFSRSRKKQKNRDRQAMLQARRAKRNEMALREGGANRGHDEDIVNKYRAEHDRDGNGRGNFSQEEEEVARRSWTRSTITKPQSRTLKEAPDHRIEHQNQNEKEWLQNQWNVGYTTEAGEYCGKMSLDNPRPIIGSTHDEESHDDALVEITKGEYEESRKNYIELHK